jgi:glycolate oxidase
MAGAEALLSRAVGSGQVLTGGRIPEQYRRDESLAGGGAQPGYVVLPQTAVQVAQVLRVASAEQLPVTARGSGSGLTGACVSQPGGIVVSFERMNRILEVDTENHTATVQPGVTLADLGRYTAPSGLYYPVRPGESSASVGGTIATNAGGMHAVRHGVTRHHVLGVEAVLATGEIIRCGGKYVKSSTGYDLTQLLVGSEGTLALITEAVLGLRPRVPHQATVVAPFPGVEEVCRAVPQLISGGLDPLALEYIDMLTMAALVADHDFGLGIPESARQTALGYLVVILEDRSRERLDADVEVAGKRLLELGSDDVYVLPADAARHLIEARERMFWTAKAAGADDIVDIVVPRAALPRLLAEAGTVASETGSIVTGCGHAGDGNVHLSVFQPDADRRDAVLRRLYRVGLDCGGAISGEHGIGRDKKRWFAEFTDPAQMAMARRIKHAFDPQGILAPGVIFD